MTADLQTPDRQRWAERIASAWRSTIESVFETGRLLIEAKADLQHGAFEAMLEFDLKFKPRMAQMLMSVARNPWLAKAHHGALLPSSWRTLYELSRLSEETFCAKFAAGEINPEMQRKDVARENRLISKARDEERVRSLTPVAGRYRTLVIDPPWDYEWLSIAGRASPGYAVMSQDELIELPVEGWAEDDSHLYLWTTNNFVGRAHELMRAWGFAYKTMLTWAKPRFGLGAYFRNQTEHVLFGVRGELRTRADNISTLFHAPMGAHSEKPDAFYEIVRTASYRPFGEVFQRTAREDFPNLYREAAAA